MLELDLSPLKALHDADQSDKATETADQKKQVSDLPKYPTLETESEHIKKQREAWQRCQNNLVRSQHRRAEILKQIQDKKEPLSILLTALETISYLTDDDVFLVQAQKDLIKAYSDE